MQEAIINYFSDFPAQWAVFILSMFPVTELRAAIPVGIGKFGMAPMEAFFWAVLGNTFMGTLVVLVVEPITKLIIEKNKFIHRLWARYIERITKKNSKSFEKWGSIALAIFIAIPIPMTGAFTGGVLASIFEIPIKKAFFTILAGCVLAGIIVTLVTLFTLEAISH